MAWPPRCAARTWTLPGSTWSTGLLILREPARWAPRLTRVLGHPVGPATRRPGGAPVVLASRAPGALVHATPVHYGARLGSCARLCAADLEGADLLCAAAGRFCGAEGIENVITGSTFRSSFGEDYGVTFSSAPLTGLLSRSVVVIDADGSVLYTEQVAETTEEPNYEAAIAVL